MHGADAMKIRRDKADDLFSKLVRERAGWCCETCNKYFPEGHRQGLHCSHLYSRRHGALRYFPGNAIAQCFGCHQRYGADPVEFTYMIEGIFGRKHMENLMVKKQGTLKIPTWYKAEIIKRLKAELDRMQEKRADGNNGRIEFKSPY